MIVTLDTRLPVESADGDWVRVRLPDGTAGWLPAADVRLTDDLSRPVPADTLFALAELLVGVPYLWGGTTTGSLDCASLPYRLFHAYGIRRAATRTIRRWKGNSSAGMMCVKAI